MIDSEIQKAAYSALTLLKKRNDRNGEPLTKYIKALEDEVTRYKTRLATPIVAHIEDFEKLTAASQAAAKELAAAPTELLKAVTASGEGVIEALARAEAQEAAAKAAAKPWWKFWAATSGGEVKPPEAGGEVPAAKEETK